ncbi:MAG: tRNA 2-thiouridine(34) synthase MnmA [Patescibacteria group bacterium]|nr:tRNA 2-thiouridine(34) synthase MnmA [Patescibacteria group bacterium]MBU1876847.1 tRNA 2-thiouridine(34) synthase MnmA [Patescibacteria group bacterium]
MDKKEKVIIGMSGGVDSSVSAALLKEQDFDVVGAFMRLSKSKKHLSAEKKSRRMAKNLKIPFLIFDFSKDFKKKIIARFLKEYSKGTPNPCVWCNQEIKFGLFLDKALKLKADYVATGHYCRIVSNKLLKGKDKTKDQSYFLWTLNQKKLKRIMFPVGDYAKKEVKELAKKLKIADLVSKESEDICFIDGNFESFIKKNLLLKPGSIINGNGDIVGMHSGLALYTIGQRKNIKIPSDSPYYVKKLDFKKNILVVTKNKKDLYSQKLKIKNVNWISGQEPKFPLKTLVKIRYLHQPAKAIISKDNKKITARFLKTQKAITPGQSAVFYGGKGSNEVLGGGIIED